MRAVKESFEMPRAWIERGAQAEIKSEELSIFPRIAAMPFTSKTVSEGLNAELVYLAKGKASDFDAVKNIKGKWLLVKTEVLDDAAGLHGLFQEYIDAIGIEERAYQSGAKGIVYMSSRPKNLLYRRLPSRGAENQIPIIIMERESATRAVRLLKEDKKLGLNVKLDISKEDKYFSDNVVAQIDGSFNKDEIVVIGAHIDSFDMGTGALDNGSNVALVIDIARQIKKLNIVPKRTIRFVLYNGEEQGLYGSWGYTKRHASELDKHIMTATVDLGTGKIDGFLTSGQTKFIPALKETLKPVSNLGPYIYLEDTVVGTDNYDFMMQGVANIVANQKDANYGSNYHAQSDTFDKVDQKQLKLNSAIMAAVVLGFANLDEVNWKRHTAKQVVDMVEKHKMKTSMKTFGLWESWKNNSRGIHH